MRCAYLAVLTCLAPSITHAAATTALAYSITAPLPATFVANFSDTHQTIDGWGGADVLLHSGGSGPYGYDSFAVASGDPLIFDRFFCVHGTDPGCTGAEGIGLNILRTELFQAAPANAQAVLARGGIIYAGYWELDPNADFTTTANGVMNNLQTYQSTWGISFYAVSTQNEPDISNWGTNRITTEIDILGPMLHSQTFQSSPIKFASVETSSGNAAPAYVSAIEADSTANAQVDIFTWHQYDIPRDPTLNGLTNDGSRHWWETETDACDAPSPSCPLDPSISNALYVAGAIHSAIVNFGASAWVYWWLHTDGTENSGTLGQFLTGNFSSNSTITKRYYTLGNYSRFVRPGWVRIGVTGSQSGIYGVGAFKNPATGAFAIVAVNNSGADIPNVTFGISGATISGSVTPIVTSGTAVGVLGTDGNLSTGSVSSGVPTSLTPNGGVFTSTVPYGVTTFTGTAH